MTSFVAAGIAGCSLATAFTAAYALARRLNNYGIVDIVWSYAFGLVAIGYAVALPGWTVRRIWLAGMVLIWSGRLGTHLWIRVAKHHPREDARYLRLRYEWAGGFAPKMFGFFQLQALSVLVLAVPFFLTTRNTVPVIQATELGATALWLIAIAGEAVADAQLASFKKKSGNPRQVCDVGLWRYSRHPNYFFEWLIWVAFALFALPAPHGWIGLLSPACILWLLLRVTGIPMTEQQSLVSKGAAFRDYQRRTSAFFPWFPRGQ